MRALVSALLCCAGCTLVTDAGDREVDPSVGRDLDYTFVDMEPHAGTPLDIVLATAPASLRDDPTTTVKLRLRTHARIVLPPIPAGLPYPEERLTLRNVIGDYDDPLLLLFYADSNDDNQIVYGVKDGLPGAEHIWREAVPATGVDSFAHSTNFENFEEKEYSLGTGHVVLTLDAQVPDWRPPPCANGRAHVLEVRVTLAPRVEARQIGLYRNYSTNALFTKSIVLEDIVDTNNEYLVETIVDGTLARPALTVRAPAQAGANLVIPQSDWFPLSPVASCER